MSKAMSKEDTSRPSSILIIDDEESVTGVVKVVLEKEGYSVSIASNGADGLAKAKELKPDLILMDISMPDMDGYAATEKIKENPDLRDIPVIFLSGRSPSEDGGRSFAKGGLTFMRKPFTNQQIKDLVVLTLQAMA